MKIEIVALFLLGIVLVHAQGPTNNTVAISAALFPVTSLSLTIELTTTKYVECNYEPLCVSISNATQSWVDECQDSCYYTYITDICDAPTTGSEALDISFAYSSLETVQTVKADVQSSLASVITCSERFGSCSSEVLGFLHSTPESPGTRAAIVFRNDLAVLDDVANAFLELTIVVLNEYILWNPLNSIYGNYGCIPFGGADNANFKVTEAGKGSYSFYLSLADLQSYGTGYYYFFVENDHKFEAIEFEYSYLWQVIHF